MTKLVRSAALIASASLMAGTLAACANTSDNSMPGMDHNATPMTGTSTTGSAAADPAGDGDVMFAQMMIPHHQQAVEMADIALAKDSSSAQVRDLATDIKKAQDPEIATMRDWLTTWGAPTSAPSGEMDHGSGMMTPADMNELKSAQGAEFDRMWMTMMIDHHQGAVTMAAQVLSTTKNPEVEQLAKAIVKAQNTEIATMRKLLEGRD